MSTVDSIFNIVKKLSVFFFINIVECCKPLSKLDLPTVRLAEKERTQRTKLKIHHSLCFEPRSSAYRADALPTELRCQLIDPEFQSL